MLSADAAQTLMSDAAFLARELDKFLAWARVKTTLRLDRDLAGFTSGIAETAWAAWLERAIEAEAAGAVDSDAAVGLTRVRLGPEAFRFTSFAEWVNKAQGWFQARIPDRAKSGQRYIALDAAGRPCLIGSDFMRARDEGQFPVAVRLIDTEGT